MAKNKTPSTTKLQAAPVTRPATTTTPTVAANTAAAAPIATKPVQPAAPAVQPVRTNPVTVTPPSPAPAAITQKQIAQRAYELYVARGYEHGHDVQDWVQAERELRIGRQ